MAGLLEAIVDRVRVRHLASAKLCRRLVQGKTGLEIGGPSRVFGQRGLVPIYSIAGEVDNCTFDQQTIWEGKVVEGKTFRFNRQKPPGKQFLLEATMPIRLTPKDTTRSVYALSGACE